MSALSSISAENVFAPPPQRERNDELGQEDFLTLMITQFRNQDPFEPMDNGEFLGQLAQFSTVNGIDSLNEGFSGLAEALTGEQALQAANLVGKRVIARTPTGYLPEGGALQGAVELEASAPGVQIDVLDASGQLVQRVNLGAQPAGLARFGWDGTDAAGRPVPAGEYTFEARVVRGNNVEGAPVLTEASIQSVTLGQNGGAMTLNLEGGQPLSLTQVYQII